jgi:hypothetical protein
MGDVPVTEGNKDVIYKDSETAAIALDIQAPTVADNETLSVTVNAVPPANVGRIMLNGQPVVVNATLTVAQLQQLQFVPAAGDQVGSFTYTVSASGGGSITTTITLDELPTTAVSGTLGFDTLPLVPSIVSGYGQSGTFAGFDWANIGVLGAPTYPNPFSGTNFAYGNSSPSTITAANGGEFTVNSVELARFVGATEITLTAFDFNHQVGTASYTLPGGDFSAIWVDAIPNFGPITSLEIQANGFWKMDDFSFTSVSTYMGGAGNDILIGSSQDDRFNGGGGNDTITGNGGNDTAIYSGNRTDYNITYNATTQTFTIADQRAGSPDGTDTVTGVAQFEFADEVIAQSLLLAETEPPSLTVQNVGGLAGSVIPLHIASAPAANGLDETLSITITGVPGVATLSAGTKNADGSWTLTQAQLAGLTVTVPVGSFGGPATLTVTSTATQTDGLQTTAQASFTLSIGGTVIVTDTTGLQPWSTQVSIYDTQGRLSSFTQNNRDGTRAVSTYDAAAAAGWAVFTAQYDSAGRITSQTGITVGQSSWTNVYDVGNQNPWSYYSNTYDAFNNLVTHAQTNDDGTSSLTVYDTTNTQTWSSFTFNYSTVDGSAWQSPVLSVVNHDGTTTLKPGEMAAISAFMDTLTWYATPYDPTIATANLFNNNEGLAYASFTTQLDANGQIASQTGTTVGGSSWKNVYDSEGTQPWAYYVDYYDVAGNLVSHTQTNDDGSSSLTAYDVDNTQPWSSFTINYSVAIDPTTGNAVPWSNPVLSVVNDDGTTTLQNGESLAIFTYVSDILIWYANPFVPAIPSYYGVALKPSLDVSDTTGGAGVPIPLAIVATLTNTDQQETLSVTITGVPSSATLSAGTRNADGSWTLTAAQLANLTLTTSAGNSIGTDVLTVTATATENDGVRASTSATMTLTVTPTPPTLAGTANAAFTEAGAPVALSPAATVSDPGSATLASATVALSGGTFAGDGDVLAASTAGTGITASYNATTETLTLSGTDTLAHYQSVLDSVTFVTASHNPTNFGADPTRTVTWTVSDGSPGVPAGTATTTINVTAVNDPPVLSGTAASVSFTEKGAPITVSGAAAVADPDNQRLASATVAITGGTFAGDGDVLAASTAGTSITASYNAATETLSLTGSDTLAHYQAVLDSVTFNSTSANPTNFGANPTRTVTWTLNDGSASNATGTASTTINITAVNDPPVLSGTANAAFTENGAAVTLSPAAAVSDPDNQTLASATVALTGGTFTGDGDVLAATTAGTGITASYNATTETLTLAGTDTLAHYQSVLDSVTFVTASHNPTNFGASPTRTVTWTVNDGSASNATGTASSTINVTAVNDPPVLSGTAASVSFTEKGGPITLSGAAAVGDPDNQRLASATVAITGGTFAGDGDVLAASTTGTSITASYNAATETLSLTGSDTLAHYQAVLDSVTFNSTSANPTNFGANPTRTVTWTLNDGSTSNATGTASTTINLTAVNDPPTLSGTANATFTTGGPAVTLSGAATVGDPDNQTLAGATVAITAGTFAGDVLAASTAGTAITASYNAATETLSLTGTDTLAHYQAVLDSVTFNSTAADPTNGGADPSRTVTWTLNDGSASNATGTATTTIAVKPPAAAPTVSASVGAPTANVAFKSLSFNGASHQTVSQIDAPPSDPTKLTVAFWFKLGATGQLEGFLSTTNSAVNDESFYIDATGHLVFNQRINNQNVTYTSSMTVTDTNWHEVVFSGDATQAVVLNKMQISLDGVRDTGVTESGNTASFTEFLMNSNPNRNASGSNPVIGVSSQTQGSAYFTGELADFYFIDGEAQMPASAFVTGSGAGTTYPGFYAGGFDAAGSWLTFANTTSATTLGYDDAGGVPGAHAGIDNWTLNNGPVSSNDGPDTTTIIPWNVSASVTDQSETLSFTVTGMPAVATLSQGTRNADGSWSLTAAQLSGLTVSVPTGSFTGSTTLTMTATATTSGGGHASAATQLVLGDAGNDTLTAGSGSVALIGGAGNDTITGGGGPDTALYSGRYGDYAITTNATTHALTVADQRAGAPDGTDTVSGVQTLQFADATAQYDASGNLRTLTIFDTTGNTSWTSFQTNYDASGHMLLQHGITVGGTSWSNIYNPSPTIAYEVAYYDQAGHVVSQTQMNNDQTSSLTAYDTTNTQQWAQFTINYSVVNDPDLGPLPWSNPVLSVINHDGSTTVSTAESQSIWTYVSDILTWYANPYVVTEPPPPGSGEGGGDGLPVLLGLNGNGINIAQLGASNAQFDMSGSGTPVPTAWAGAGNGILAIDLGADGSLSPDGVIDQAKEIEFTQWAPGTTSDMAALAQVFDTNHNGALDAGDADWNDFRVWVNSDGAGTGQLATLAQLGITSISLSPSGPAQTLADGSVIQGLSTYTMANGTTGVAGDVALAYGSGAAAPIMLSNGTSADAGVAQLVSAMAATPSGGGALDATSAGPTSMDPNPSPAIASALHS